MEQFFKSSISLCIVISLLLVVVFVLFFQFKRNMKRILVTMKIFLNNLFTIKLIKSKVSEKKNKVNVWMSYSTGILSYLQSSDPGLQHKFFSQWKQRIHRRRSRLNIHAVEISVVCNSCHQVYFVLYYTILIKRCFISLW